MDVFFFFDQPLGWLKKNQMGSPIQTTEVDGGILPADL